MSITQAHPAKIHPDLADLVEPLVRSGFEVGILRDRWGLPSQTLYVRRNGNCGYICREDLYSTSGLIVCFQNVPSREFGSGILMSVPGEDRDPRTVDEVVAAAKLATEHTTTEGRTVLANYREGTTAWHASGFERLDGGDL